MMTSRKSAVESEWTRPRSSCSILVHAGWPQRNFFLARNRIGAFKAHACWLAHPAELQTARKKIQTGRTGLRESSSIDDHYLYYVLCRMIGGGDMRVF